MQPNHWLPITEYALRSGVSISTLRRKIKSNAIDFKMEDGRYLIRFDAAEDSRELGFSSSDGPPTPNEINVPGVDRAVLSSLTSSLAGPQSLPPPSSIQAELAQISTELRVSREEGALRWRALEVRVAGLARKLETYTEQMAELKMLIKIFEERLDGHR